MERDPAVVTLEGDLQAVVARLEQGELGARQLWMVIDLLAKVLADRQVLTEGHLRVIDKLRNRSPAMRPAVRLHQVSDKYAIEGPEIDCAAHFDQCHARCCAMAVELSHQDLEERQLPWQIEEPYLLVREADGYCVKLDRRTAGCCDYEHRPARCREFDCRRDPRIWIDFEANLAVPLWYGLVPPGPGRASPANGEPGLSRGS